jgi:AcrR family transcriptional regulator
MNVSRTERKKEETRQKIIREAMHLFIQQGVDATTMEKIAEQVDIAKGTLYNYFPVKEAIIDAYIHRSFAERSAKMLQEVHALPDTRSRLMHSLMDLMKGVQAQPEIFEKYHAYRVKNLISLRQDETEATGIGQLTETIISLGQKDGEIRTDLPTGLLLDLYEFVFIEVAMQFYRNPRTFDARPAIDACVDLFLNGAKSLRE